MTKARQKPAPRELRPDTKVRTSDGAITRRYGLYLSAGTMRDARAAYIADLDDLEYPAESLAEWIERAMLAHADLDPNDRGKAAQDAPERPEARGNHGIFFDPAAIIQVDAARKLERLAGLPPRSRSAFVSEAMEIGIHHARRRRGSLSPVDRLFAPPPRR